MLRRACKVVLCALLAAATAAHAAPPLAAADRQGYAFENLRILTQQRLFGIYHGVGLLVTACQDLPAYAEATRTAHVQWQQTQQDGIEHMQVELAQFYYGPHAAEATQQDIAQALGLRDHLALTANAPELGSACATLPKALQQPRYDLAGVFKLEAAQARTQIAVRAEMQSTACSQRLPDEAPAIKSAWLQWQKHNHEIADSAKAEVLALWPLKQVDDKAQDWLDALQRRFGNPAQSSCQRLTAWLESPAADLEKVFSAPPAEEQTSATAVQVFAVHFDAGDDAPPLSSPAAQPELMKLFKP